MPVYALFAFFAVTYAIASRISGLRSRDPLSPFLPIRVFLVIRVKFLVSGPPTIFSSIWGISWFITFTRISSGAILSFSFEIEMNSDGGAASDPL